ncbi:MAG TPA: Ppx/GppA phosphatase family protein, partial [Patescibacteria group bacterium]|nr:Ppx/GppA phosphatase family protein [Patescibacteria group bacterium]
MKRGPIAVIDIGSNTIRSLIVETLPGGGYRILDDEREAARLASGLDSNGRLAPAAVARAVKALKRMAEIARARGARRAAVVATSAIRGASNRRSFVNRVARETGLRVRVISGAEEAQLAFESAALSFDLENRPCGVADVGGGSTEVILALGHHVQHVYSLSLGTVALTEQFLHSDPIKRKEFKSLRAAVRQSLEEEEISGDPRPQFLIASGGTASAIAQVSMALQGMSGRPVQGFEMTQAELLHLREALLARSLSERRQLPGLSADRADIIVAGVTILYEILAHLKVNTLRISARGIRHALVNRMITRNSGARAAALTRPRRLAAAASFARSLRFEQRHGEQVQRIALSLFDQLASRLHLEESSRDLLAAAALLHDVGYVVSFTQHHKHTYHLIAHAQLDGFTPEEREIIALVARFHRRTPPKKKHATWVNLPRPRRDLVRRLSALLRVADGLDRRHTQALLDVKCRVVRGKLRLTLVSEGDLDVEVHAAEEKADMFRDLFGLELVFCRARTGHSARSIHFSGEAPAARRS